MITTVSTSFSLLLSDSVLKRWTPQRREHFQVIWTRWDCRTDNPSLQWLRWNLGQSNGKIEKCINTSLYRTPHFINNLSYLKNATWSQHITALLQKRTYFIGITTRLLWLTCQWCQDAMMIVSFLFFKNMSNLTFVFPLFRQNSELNSWALFQLTSWNLNLIDHTYKMLNWNLNRNAKRGMYCNWKNSK